MADNSAIEWTDATWNPVTGCTKVSPGCDHCYAERIVERFKGKGAFEEVALNRERLGAPLHWRKPRRVFVNSMSDLFHEDVPDEFIARVFDTMQNASRHTFQVLTKRHARMRSFVTRYLSGEFITDWTCGPLARTVNLPPYNIWLGVSVEDQKWADIRIPALLGTPAAVRFLSCEPLLGPINIWRSTSLAVDWVIAGGESGPHAREMHPVWARSLRDQCVVGGTPFFFKQWGGRTPKANGRELDGRTWDEYPEEVLRVG